MNIEGAKILPVTASSAVVEAGPQVLTEDSAMPEGFAEALTEQIQLASEAKGLDSVPKPLQQLASGENLNRLHSLAGLLGNQGAAQELAAIVGKDLPVSYKIGDEEDIEATLSTLTDALNRLTTGRPSEQDESLNPGYIVGVESTESAVANIAGNTLDLTEGDALKNKSAGGSGLDSDNAQAESKSITDGISVTVSEVQSDNPIASAEAMEVIKAMLASAFSPAQEGGKFTEAAEGRGKSALKLPLSAVNQPAGAIYMKGSEETGASEEQAEVDGAFRQIVKDSQEMLGLNKAGGSEKMESAGLVAEIGTEGALPRVAADLIQPNRPMADGRIDVPAMVKPLGHPEWNQDLGERILWMHNKAMPAAEIKLSPQHLGPISVRIDMSQDQATVTFTAQHANVREALEASVPRLREMMNAQQINLGDVNVFQNSSEQRHSQSQGYAQSSNEWDQGGAHKTDDAMVDATDEAGSHSVVVSKGLLSIYA